MSGPQSVEGLITRIGRWLDRRFQAKATQEELRYFWNQLENASIKDKVELMDRIEEKTNAQRRDLEAFQAVTLKAVALLESKIDKPEDVVKDLADLKTRLEKIELYSGMTRKVDPTKPPVVKSAFQM